MLKKAFDILRYLKHSCKEPLNWILIRFILKFPSKHIRRFCLNLYKDVHIDKSALLYGGMYWWEGPLEIGGGCNIGFTTVHENPLTFA